MTLEEIETIRARSDRLNPGDLAVLLVRLWKAAGFEVFGTRTVEALQLRGLTEHEAIEIVGRVSALLD